MMLGCSCKLKAGQTFFPKNYSVCQALNVWQRNKLNIISPTCIDDLLSLCCILYCQFHLHWAQWNKVILLDTDICIWLHSKFMNACWSARWIIFKEKIVKPNPSKVFLFSQSFDFDKWKLSELLPLLKEQHRLIGKKFMWQHFCKRQNFIF